MRSPEGDSRAGRKGGAGRTVHKPADHPAVMRCLCHPKGGDVWDFDQSVAESPPVCHVHLDQAQNKSIGVNGFPDELVTEVPDPDSSTGDPSKDRNATAGLRSKCPKNLGGPVAGVVVRPLVSGEEGEQELVAEWIDRATGQELELL